MKDLPINKEVTIHHKPWSRGFDVYIRCYDRVQKKDYVATELKFEERELHKEPDHPSFHMSYDDVQHLFDSLWADGMRPSNGVENAGQLKATQDHLQDLRSWNEKLWDVHVSKTVQGENNE